jgi:hypothetical protein
MSKKAKKVAVKKPAPKSDNVVTLRDLCTQLKTDPTAARVKLRAAVAKGTIKHEAKSSWEWAKDSAALSDARKVLSE